MVSDVNLGRAIKIPHIQSLKNYRKLSRYTERESKDERMRFASPSISVGDTPAYRKAVRREDQQLRFYVS